MSGPIDYRNSDLWQSIERIRATTQSRGEQVLGNFSYYVGKCELLYKHVKQLQPKVIVEVGWNCGHSAVIMLHASPSSRLVSFDIADREYMLTVADLIKSKHPSSSFHVGDSKVILPQVLQLEDLRVDFALIDGDHTYEAVTADLTAVAPHMSLGGLIFIDDLDVEGIRRAVDEFNWTGFTLVDQGTFDRFTKDRVSSVVVYRKDKIEQG